MSKTYKKSHSITQTIIALNKFVFHGNNYLVPLQKVSNLPVSIYLVYMQLAIYRWACWSACANQRKTNETITELRVWHSVKNTFPKLMGNIAGTHIIWMTWLLITLPTCPWNNMSGQQYLLINNKNEPDLC